MVCSASSGSGSGGEERRFAYNSLKELISATNPENATVANSNNGTITYAYYDSGDLKMKTAPGVTTSYTYDVLSRPKSKTYSDSASGVAYAYDAVQVGCLDSVTSGVYVTSYTSYDPYCRVTGSLQKNTSTSPVTSYWFTYNYNLASALTREVYPSGRAITTTYDLAGRPNGVSGSVPYAGGTIANCNGISNYQGICYAAHGAISQLPLGNGLLETTNFDNRLRINQIQAGSLLTLGYSYYANGNVYTHSVNDGTTTRNQTFSYDGVNRLTGASEGSTWAQTYVYDAFGNRALLSSSNSLTGGTDGLFSDPTTTTTSVPFDSNNHWSFTGAHYDQRGNLDSVTAGNNSFQSSYDGENRLVSSTVNLGGNSSATTYAYDGTANESLNRWRGGQRRTTFMMHLIS